MGNIEYKTTEIANYFSANRTKWEHFYNSEKQLIKRLNLKGNEDILDIEKPNGGYEKYKQE